jgi:hypothetical protein
MSLTWSGYGKQLTKRKSHVNARKRNKMQGQNMEAFVERLGRLSNPQLEQRLIAVEHALATFKKRNDRNPDQLEFQLDEILKALQAEP